MGNPRQTRVAFPRAAAAPRGTRLMNGKGYQMTIPDTSSGRKVSVAHTTRNLWINQEILTTYQ